MLRWSEKSAVDTKFISVRSTTLLLFIFPSSFVNIVTLQPICIQQNVYSNIDLYRRINDMQHMVNSRMENIPCINSIQPQYNNENFGSFRGIHFFYAVRINTLHSVDRQRKREKSFNFQSTSRYE